MEPDKPRQDAATYNKEEMEMDRPAHAEKTEKQDNQPSTVLETQGKTTARETNNQVDKIVRVRTKNKQYDLEERPTGGTGPRSLDKVC